MMKIIISPAKKMKRDADTMGCHGLPVFLQEAETLKTYIKGLTYQEAKKLWNCNDRIAELNFQRFAQMDLKAGLTPALLAYEGITRNTKPYLERGDTILEILGENLPDAVVLDLAGCSLDAVLYYVNPVLALTEKAGAVLLVGFNEAEVGIMNPATGTIYTMKNSEAAEWFEENGNQFITYLRADQ